MKTITLSQAPCIGDFTLNLRIGADGLKLLYLILSRQLAIGGWRREVGKALPAKTEQEQGISQPFTKSTSLNVTVQW